MARFPNPLRRDAFIGGEGDQQCLVLGEMIEHGQQESRLGRGLAQTTRIEAG